MHPWLSNVKMSLISYCPACQWSNRNYRLITLRSNGLRHW